MVVRDVKNAQNVAMVQGFGAEIEENTKESTAGAWPT